jgi:uncharacterized repeat protein (TIGR03803 family)
VKSEGRALTFRAKAAWSVARTKNNGTDGAYPEDGLILDAAGNLYGTTMSGGTYNYGTVFELTPTVVGWTKQVLRT